MTDLTTLPHQLDAKTRVCRAVIETPKGCRNKFDYDPESGLFMLAGPDSFARDDKLVPPDRGHHELAGLWVAVLRPIDSHRIDSGLSPALVASSPVDLPELRDKALYLRYLLRHKAAEFRKERAGQFARLQ